MRVPVYLDSTDALLVSATLSVLAHTQCPDPNTAAVLKRVGNAMKAACTTRPRGGRYL